MLPETRSHNSKESKVYYNQQQQYPATTMLDHQPIELVSENHHENATPSHNSFGLQASSSSSPTPPTSFNKFDHSTAKIYHDSTVTEEEKRQQVLEKNRLAASKCRQRKKAWVEELTKKSDQAMHQNASLKRVITQLKEDILFLKSQLLLHRGCQCQIINNYIKLHMIDSFQHLESSQSNPYNQCLDMSPYRNSFC